MNDDPLAEPASDSVPEREPTEGRRDLRSYPPSRSRYRLLNLHDYVKRPTTGESEVGE